MGMSDHERPYKGETDVWLTPLEIINALGEGDIEMSWGERSCKPPCRVPNECTMQTCNVNCKGYIWDGINKPDSEMLVDMLMATPSQKQGPNRAERRAKK